MLRNQIINSNELSYILRGQILKLRISGYYTTVNNSTEINRYFAELSDSTGGDVFVSEIISGMNKVYKGVEIGADWKITPTFNAMAAASIGDYTVSNDPHVSYAADRVFRVQGLTDMGTAYLKDYKLAGTPQKAYTLALRYNSPKFWWVGVSGNYLMDNYLDFSALNRTTNFFTDPNTGDPYVVAGQTVTQDVAARYLSQTKFDDQFMLNANAGKSFLIGKYRLGISVSVNNILNNRNYVTGGYEQARKSNFPEFLADTQLQRPLFGPKLWYDRGTTFFTNIYLRF